jgi:hypothetical protein
LTPTAAFFPKNDYRFPFARIIVVSLIGPERGGIPKSVDATGGAESVGATEFQSHKVQNSLPRGCDELPTIACEVSDLRQGRRISYGSWEVMRAQYAPAIVGRAAIIASQDKLRDTVNPTQSG